MRGSWRRSAATNSLPPFTPAGVARVIEHASRMAEDQRKLTTRLSDIVDVVRESAYWAAHRNGDVTDRPTVDLVDVQRALDQRLYRSARIEERIREMIARGRYWSTLEGAVVGQVNGLSVIGMGDHASASRRASPPPRVWASGEVVDIEREVEMGGPIHSKGVMILAGYLGRRYAPDGPCPCPPAWCSSSRSRGRRRQRLVGRTVRHPVVSLRASRSSSASR